MNCVHEHVLNPFTIQESPQSDDNSNYEINDNDDEFTEDTDDAINGTVEYCMTSHESLPDSFAVLDSTFDD